MNFKIDTYIMYVHAANSRSVSEDTLVQAIVGGIVGVVVFLLLEILKSNSYYIAMRLYDIISYESLYLLSYKELNCTF